MSTKHIHPVILSVKRNLVSLGVAPTSSILVGVSGGMDSMVLLFILHKLGYNPSAAHVNFNLRGAESYNDALFVKQWCLDQGIPSFELSKDTNQYADANHLNTQTAARNIRYEWWEYLVHSHKFDLVATAHQLDDAIETVLLNLLRGTGLKGLKGIPAHRDFYIRPLLSCSRKDIEAFALEFDIPFREDSSNKEDAYQRNRIRHQLIPMLEELAPGFYSGMQHTLHRVNIEWNAWEHAFDTWQLVNVKSHSNGYTIHYEQRDLPFMLRWLEEKGIPWNLGYDFLNATKADSGHFLQVENQKLSRTEEGYYFEEIHPPIHFILQKPGRYAFGDFSFSIEPASGDISVKDHGPGIEYVSADSIRWPLHIRNVRPGDHFQPIGMQGKTKKIQDLMVDLKLEMFEKTKLLLLTNDDYCIWVIGFRLDERAKVKPDEKEVYKVTYTPEEKG
jgi:tRNA(Ile)-lysidine synthase